MLGRSERSQRADAAHADVQGGTQVRQKGGEGAERSSASSDQPCPPEGSSAHARSRGASEQCAGLEAAKGSAANEHEAQAELRTPPSQQASPREEEQAALSPRAQRAVDVARDAAQASPRSSAKTDSEHGSQGELALTPSGQEPQSLQQWHDSTATLDLLHVFAGSPNAASMSTAASQGLGRTALDLDTKLGGREHNVRSTEVRQAGLALCSSGRVKSAWMGVPCSSYSRVRGRKGGAPRLRGRKGLERLGLPNLAAHWQAYLTEHITSCWT